MKHSEPLSNQGKESVYFTTGRPKIVPSHGDLDPYLIRDSLGAFEPTTQMASQSVQPFSHSSPQSVPVLYNGTHLPLQNCPFPWAMWTPSNTWFYGPTRVLNQTASQSVQPFLQGSVVWQINRQTAVRQTLLRRWK